MVDNITHPIIIDYLLSKQLQTGKNPFAGNCKRSCKKDKRCNGYYNIDKYILKVPKLNKDECDKLSLNLDNIKQKFKEEMIKFSGK